MTEIAPIPTHLGHDVLCIGCGYNLRGLEPSGRCPECGLAIADSVRGVFLRFADPAWLNKLRFGASLKLWNILITILISFAAGLLVGFMGAPPAIVILISAVGAALGLWASFCITAQEPRVALTEDPVTLRKIIRVCAITACAGGITQQLANTTFIRGPTLSGIGAFWMMVSLISGAAGLVVMIGELKYFRRFALRAPDPRLARSTRILMWGLGITMGLTSIGGVLFAMIVAPRMAAMGAGGPITTTTSGGVTSTMTITPGGAAATPVAVPGVGSAFIGIGACIFFPIAGIFFLWYVSLLSRYRKLFQTALVQAQSTVQH